MTPAYVALICLSILLVLIYVGMIYGYRKGDLFGVTITFHNLLLYLGAPTALITLILTLYSTYRPMQHYPPLFIMVLYALLGGLYTGIIGYFWYRKVMSIPSCIMILSVFVAVVLGIFLYTPSTYDTNINEVQDKFLKDRFYQQNELNQLQEELMGTFSAKNKYYLQWFIALLYVPILIHYPTVYRCKINPIAYQYIANYLMNLLNLKPDMDHSFIHQSNDMLETLKELDKTITYTPDEKQVIDKIREAIVNKLPGPLAFTPEERTILKKLRQHLAQHDAIYRNKNAITSLYQAVTSLIQGNKTAVEENGLYLMNILVLSIILIYVFMYEHSTQYLIIPLFTALLSLSIFYLK